MKLLHHYIALIYHHGMHEGLWEKYPKAKIINYIIKEAFRKIMWQWAEEQACMPKKIRKARKPKVCGFRTNLCFWTISKRLTSKPWVSCYDEQVYRWTLVELMMQVFVECVPVFFAGDVYSSKTRRLRKTICFRNTDDMYVLLIAINTFYFYFLPKYGIILLKKTIAHRLSWKIVF